MSAFLYIETHVSYNEKSPCVSNNTMREKLIFDLSRSGRKGYTLSGHDLPEMPLDSILPSRFLRQTPAELPEVSESEVVRHFVRLSNMNYHVDKNMYPAWKLHHEVQSKDQ